MDLRHVREASSESSFDPDSHTQQTSGASLPPVWESKYRAIAELGRGGMATVYLALAQGVGGFSKLVVLKCIRPEIATETEFVTMFMDEARLAACLSHPNIVQTNEVIEQGGVPVIVMEYLEGRTLYEILRRGRRLNKPIAVGMHLHILIEVLRGLHYAHEAKDLQGSPLNLVHRDVSPQNILVTYSGEVKILDFGVAKSAEASQETRSGVLKGKIRYMAPEQVLGNDVDRRADVYSVGVLLWQALAGRDFWQGQSDLDVMQAIVTESLTPLREAAKDLPAGAEQLVAGALTYNPEDRFQTAAIFGQKILELLKHIGPRPETREVELYLNELFAEDRERNRALIAERISAAQDAQASGHTEGAPLRQAPIGTLPMLSVSTTAGGRDGAWLRRGLDPRRRSWPWLAVGIALALVAGAGIAQYTRAGQPGEPQITQAPLAADGPSRAPVKVRISATPSEARLLLDGTPLSRNPYEESLVPDGQRHVVRAELAGYVPRQEVFDLNNEVMVSIALERELSAPPVASARLPSSATSASRVGWARHRPPAANAASASASSPTGAERTNDCDPPYFVDSEGIRRVRPGCS